MEFSINQLIQWKVDEDRWQDERGRTIIERVLAVLDGGAHLVVIETDRRNTRAHPFLRSAQETLDALHERRARLLSADPYAYVYLPQQPPLHHRRRRDRAWAAIRPIVEGRGDEIFSPNVRTPLIADAARRAGVDIRVIHTWLRYYWQGGQSRNALLPQFAHCGAPDRRRTAGQDAPKRGRPRRDAAARGGGINVTALVEERFEAVLRRYYMKEHLSLRVTYDRLIEKWYATEEPNSDGYLVYTPVVARPTYKQLCAYARWRRAQDPAGAVIGREGERAYNLRYRPVTGRGRRGVFGPGSYFQVDATVFNVHLVNGITGEKLIGKATVYFIVDVFSGLIAGVAVTLEPPSWAGVMLALENMTLNKVALCREYRVPCPLDAWPARHIPKVFVADKGELLQRGAAHMIKTLNIRLTNTPSYRPDLKPFVEARFHALKKQLAERLPGHTRSHGQPERGERDPRRDAILTPYELRRLVFSYVVEFNTTHPLDPESLDQETRVAVPAPTPAKVWAWGVVHRGGLGTMDQDTMRRNLLRRGVATSHGDGLHYDGKRYTCKRGEREGWFIRSKAHTSARRVAVLENPRDFRILYLLPDPDVERAATLQATRAPGNDTLGALEVCTLLGEEYETPMDWAEARAQHESEARARARDEARALSVRITQGAFRSDVVAQRKREAKAAPGHHQSHSARVRGIRDNRRAERDREREDDSWAPPPVVSQPRSAAPVAARPPAATAAPESGQARRLAMMRQMRVRDKQEGAG